MIKRKETAAPMAKATKAGKTVPAGKGEKLQQRPAHGTNRGAFGFPVHGQRSAALGEVHARPAPAIETPRTLIKLAFMTEGGNTVDLAVLAELTRQNGVAPPADGARHFRMYVGNGSLWWERHTEASTWLWEGEAVSSLQETAKGHPFGDAFPAPGLLIAAVRIDVLPWTDDYEGVLAFFNKRTLCCSMAEGGLAVVATDFRQDEHGMTRVVIFDKGMASHRTGALAQRLFDIEIYRTMAMLGLPLAQGLAPRMRKSEDRLAELTHQMRRMENDDADALLDEFTGLAAELEADAASSLYRFGASRAYDEIVKDRLEVLDETPVAGYDTWQSFLGRRLAPAMRTCQAIEERQANLSRKLSRAANLLRTRVDVEVEKQNRDVLHSMNRRAKLQLRLQQTVEGLSVAAVSYYVVGLFGYAVKGFSDHLPVKDNVLVAAFVPFAILLIWWIVQRIKKHHAENDGADDA